MGLRAGTGRTGTGGMGVRPAGSIGMGLGRVQSARVRATQRDGGTVGTGPGATPRVTLLVGYMAGLTRLELELVFKLLLSKA